LKEQQVRFSRFFFLKTNQVPKRRPWGNGTDMKPTIFITKCRYKYLLALVLAMLWNIPLWAEHISQKQAQQIAQEFFAEKARFLGKATCTAASAPMLKSPSTAESRDPSFYIFNHADANAYVILASDDALPAVVGYSLTGTFDPDHMPEALRAYLADYSRVASALVSNPSAEIISTKGGTAVAPLVKVKWNQDDPYNRLCPEGRNGKSVTGCVATAIGQIMKYHEFPLKGNGTVTDSNNRSLTLGHEYDWANMLDTYTDGSFTDAQATAVATLLRDVGYAVKMQYSSDESSAYSSEIASALVRNFNYSKDIKTLCRTAFTSQGWVDEIRANLLRGEPVLYSGSDGPSGHQFVCDGIDANDFLHINWGWGGYSDGYFDMNILSPQNLGIGAGGGAYYRDQDIVVNIRPGNPDEDNLTWDAPLSIMNVKTPVDVDEDGLFPKSMLFALTYTVLNTSGSAISSYKYRGALMVKDKSGKIIGYSNMKLFGDLYSHYYKSCTVSLDLDNFPSYGTGLPDGEYCVSFVFSSSATTIDETTICIPDGGDLTDVWITRRDGNTYLNNKYISSNKGGEIVAEVVNVENNAPIYIGSGTSSTINITLRNSLPVSVEESFCLYLVPENEVVPDMNPAQDKYLVFNTNVFINGGAERTCPFRIPDKSDRKAGRYQVFITCLNKTLPSAESFYVTFKEFPKDQLVMTSALTITPNTLARNTYVFASINFSYINPGAQFFSPIEIWGKPVGGSDDDLFLMFKSDEDICFSKGSSSFSSDELLSEEDAVWYKNLGEYEAIVKYRDTNSEFVPFPGELNSAKFTLIEGNDYPCLAELASPMLINGGNPVIAKDNAVFDIQFDIMSPTGMIIDPTQEDIFYVKLTPYDVYYIWEFETEELNFSKTELAPGETTTVTGKIRYCSNGNPPKYVDQTLYVTLNYIYLSYYVARLQTLPYIDQTGFFWCKDTSSALDNIEVSEANKPYAMGIPEGIQIRCLTADAQVSVYSISGVKVIDNIRPDNAGNAIVRGLPAGMYIVTATTPTTSSSITAIVK